MAEKKEIKELRPYQKECIELLNQTPSGHHLISLATGLGKTVIMSRLERPGRTLILSHRDELVRQPEKYFDCSFGVEKAEEHAEEEDVVSASVQSLCKDNRLSRYSPDDFNTIIIDEAHHSAAPTYKKIVDYFSGAKRLLGFTATPKRGDGVRLDDVFEDIVFSRDLRWGIKNGYLCNVRCMAVQCSLNLKKVKTVAGDYSSAQLESALEKSDAIPVAAKAYIDECNPKGRHTLIYCLTKKQCTLLKSALTELLPDEDKNSIEIVTGDTGPELRRDILARFSSGELKAIINCMVLTEGTDLPVADCILNVRPTCNPTLYQQIVGRGTRLYPGKQNCLVIDIVPSDMRGSRTLCTAPTLFGVDPQFLTEKQKSRFSPENDLLEACEELENDVTAVINIAKSIEIQISSLENLVENYEDILEPLRNGDLNGTLTMIEDSLYNKDIPEIFGDLQVKLEPESSKRYHVKSTYWDDIYISEPDVLGNSTIEISSKYQYYKGSLKFEEAVELTKMICETDGKNYKFAWSRESAQTWKDARATEKQESKTRGLLRKNDIKVPDLKDLNKLAASRLIDLITGYEAAKAELSELQGKPNERKATTQLRLERFAERRRKEAERIAAGTAMFDKYVDRTRYKAENERRRNEALERQGGGLVNLALKTVAMANPSGAPTSGQIVFFNTLKRDFARNNNFFPDGLEEAEDYNKQTISVAIGLMMHANNNMPHHTQNYYFRRQSFEKIFATISINQNAIYDVSFAFSLTPETIEK